MGKSSRWGSDRKQPVDERRRRDDGEYVPEHCPEAARAVGRRQRQPSVILRRGQRPREATVREAVANEGGTTGLPSFSDRDSFLF